MKRFQTGSASVELAMVGLFFFMTLLGVIETGRLMFTWNALTEATRLGARAASVCPVQNAAIGTIATFNANGLITGLQSDNIIVNYLDEDGAVVGNPTPGNPLGFSQVKFVQVSIQGFQYDLLIPGIPSVSLPLFSTTLPRQSLGITPNEASGC
ncbi:MAG TPA: pilus assembly protein [Gammaproteobacteria bacterium]|nr:pilus assembly protein [Gammaproteobacteria bacterium]